MKIVPQYDWIYVKVKKVKAIGLIQMPDEHTPDEEVVEVLEIGPDVTRVKKGDRVAAVGMTGQKILIDGEARIFIREENVIAKVED